MKKTLEHNQEKIGIILVMRCVIVTAVCLTFVHVSSSVHLSSSSVGSELNLLWAASLLADQLLQFE